MPDSPRWNQSQAAADYDAATPAIHPHYTRVQDEVLAVLASPGALPARRIVDLGGGSGRLAERLLEALPGCCVTVVDQSAAFLALATRRLSQFVVAGRATTVECPVQSSDWSDTALANGPVDAIVSTSALHHLDPSEKQAVFAKCFAVLRPGGVFINGDEYRPQADADYRAMLQAWGEHMDAALADGRIPASFDAMLAKWRSRNLDRFGGPRQSGDDCHETIATQTAYLQDAGFKPVRTTWRRDLWAVLVAEKPSS
ncbi:MAG: class I SAM-dependent methyltransferase [Planctomycetota bacterium]